MFYTSVYGKSITDKSATNKKPILTKLLHTTLKVSVNRTKVILKSSKKLLILNRMTSATLTVPKNKKFLLKTYNHGRQRWSYLWKEVKFKQINSLIRVKGK